MVTPTWTLSLREAGNGSDTAVTANNMTGTTFPDLTRGQTIRFELGFQGNRTGYETARQLLEYAGLASVGVDNAGDPYWADTVTTTESPVDSQAIQMVPDASMDAVSVRGFWGVVVGGQELSVTGADLLLELRVFVLGEDSDYADRSALETALNVDP